MIMSSFPTIRYPLLSVAAFIVPEIYVHRDRWAWLDRLGYGFDQEYICSTLCSRKRFTLYSRKRFLYIVGNASIWLETLPSYRKRFLLPATYLSTSLVYPWAETLPSACWKRFLLPVDRKRFLLPVTIRVTGINVINEILFKKFI